MSEDAIEVLKADEEKAMAAFADGLTAELGLHSWLSRRALAPEVGFTILCSSFGVWLAGSSMDRGV